MSKTRPYVSDGLDHQGRFPQRSGAQLTSELLEEAPRRTGRHRPISPIKRALIRGHHASYSFPLVVFVSIVCAVVWCRYA